MQGLMAQISASDYVDIVSFENDIPDETVAVNTIRFQRALVNLVENSYYAKSTKITFRIYLVGQGEEPMVCFSVADNGSGIESEAIERIWTEGYSTRQSYGLGLSFVDKVITQSGGTADISSRPGCGTQVRLMVPVWRE